MGPWRFLFTCLIVAVTAIFSTATAFAEVRIVAVGTSGIWGAGVLQSEAYPAQLERALRAKGHQVTVTNQGIHGDITTDGLLARLDGAVPSDTDIVILQIGSHDQFHGVSLEVTAANTRTMVERFRAKGIEVYVLEKMQRSIWNRVDLHVESPPRLDVMHWHLTPAGYAIVVRRTLPAIEALVRKVEKRGHG
jgi:hypothetical protein